MNSIQEVTERVEMISKDVMDNIQNQLDDKIRIISIFCIYTGSSNFTFHIRISSWQSFEN